jgi:hypothetical protein
MNNEPTASGEPVAYAMFRDGEYYDAIHPDEQAKTAGEYDIPLYTHPAKTLTDEEIIKVYEDMLGVASAKSSAIEFARAILRKAQEK